MFSLSSSARALPTLLLGILALNAGASTFRVQCVTSTTLHPTLPAAPNSNPVGGQIKRPQISGGGGFATMAAGTQTYLFAFGPLSGLADMRNGLPDSEPAQVFNTLGDPINNPASNGAVGLAPDPNSIPPHECCA